MSQLNIRPSLHSIEVNPIQKALDDYHLMEHQRDVAMAQVADLRATNGALVAEVSMLREQVRVSDRDRLRLQAVASTFGGQARSLSSIFNDIMALAIKNGIEAADKADPALEQAANEAQEVLQRVQPATPIQPPERPIASPRVSGALLGSTIPAAVDWSKLPQGSVS